MKTPKEIILPDPEEVKDFESLREYLRQLNELLDEEHINIYEDLKQLQP